MIAINGTILFQAIHFFIAYLIIRFLILRPILATIFKEKQQRDTLIARIQQTKEKVVQHEQEKKNMLMRYKNYFAMLIPITGLKKQQARVPQLQPIPVDAKSVKEQTNKLADLLIKKGESL